MSEFIQIDTKDFDGFVQRLEKYGRRGDEAVMKAVKELALEGSGVMAKSAPRVTGRLASSIHYETEKTTGHTYRDNQGRGFDGSFSQRPTGLSAAMGSNVSYAHDVNQRSTNPRFFEKGFKHAENLVEQRLRFYLNKLMNES